MNRIEVVRTAVDSCRVGTIPCRRDYRRVIDGDTLLCEAGTPVVAYFAPDGTGHAPILRALAGVDFRRSFRTNGLETTSRTFGFTPRNVIRGDYCSAVALARESPAAHGLLCGLAPALAARYRAANPGLYAAHEARAAADVVADYRLEGTPFTSGNVNRNDTLAYHYDRGNFPGVWSCSLVLRAGCRGGYLVLPEYSAALRCDHGSLVLFDGQSLLHGVSPVRRTSPHGVRYSAVYYSLRQVWQCLAAPEELDRIRRVKTEREVALVGRSGYAGGKPEIRAALRAAATAVTS